jgi:preprotein translocase subunit SecY
VIGRITNLFRVPEIRRRLWVTLLFLLAYRVGSGVPIPGLDLGVLRQMEANQGGGLAAFIDLLSAGSIFSGSLFSMGIMPYISASIIFSLLVKVVPRLEAIQKEGSAGQKRINQWTRLAAVPIAFAQALIIVNSVLGNPAATGTTAPLLPSGFGILILASLALTTGVIVLMWFGEQITEYGIGNGISLLIMAGIIARLPQNVVMMVSQNANPVAPVLLLILFFIVVVVVVYITKGTRKIPVQYAKLTRGRRVYGGQRHFLPIKVNQAGVMPVIFASSLLALPMMLGAAFNWPWLKDFGMRGSFWYTAIDVALIYFFSYFWTSLMFNPTEMSKNMKEHGSFVPGIRPGRRTAEFLDAVMRHITLAGATFLAVIAIVPQWLAQTATTNSQIAAFLGGTSILIVVSVALDLVDKLNSHLLMRNYEGFMRGGGGGTGRSQ